MDIFCGWFFVLYKSAERVASSFYSMFCIAAAIFEEQSWRYVQVCAMCANVFWNCSGFFLSSSLSLFPCVLIVLFFVPCLPWLFFSCSRSKYRMVLRVFMLDDFNVPGLFPMLVYGSSFYVSCHLWAWCLFFFFLLSCGLFSNRGHALL